MKERHEIKNYEVKESSLYSKKYFFKMLAMNIVIAVAFFLIIYFCSAAVVLLIACEMGTFLYTAWQTQLRTKAEFCKYIGPWNLIIFVPTIILAMRYTGFTDTADPEYFPEIAIAIAVIFAVLLWKFSYRSIKHWITDLALILVFVAGFYSQIIIINDISSTSRPVIYQVEEKRVVDQTRLPVTNYFLELKYDDKNSCTVKVSLHDFNLIEQGDKFE